MSAKSNKAKLEKLNISKQQIKNRLLRLATFIKEVDIVTPDKLMLSQIDIRFQKLKDCWNEFNQVQSEIDLIEGFPDPEWDTFEETYFELHSKYTDALHNLSPRPASDCESICSSKSAKGHSDPQTKIKLPAIELPTFNGSYDQFASYIELFKSLIHSNSSIPPIQKFHFLKTSLKGDAAALIQSLELSESNYQVAFDLLHNRYDNRRLLVNHHIQAFFNLGSVEKEKSTQLRLLLDESLKHIRALNSLGEPTNSWDTLLVYTLANKLDPFTRKAWETSIASTETSPSFKLFTDFLNTRCKILESCQIKVSQNGRPNVYTSPSNSKQPAIKSYSSLSPNTKRSSSSFVSLDSKGRTIKCNVCKEGHVTYQCPDLINLPVGERSKLIAKLNLCLNCFWPHRTIQCKSKYSCSECGKRHNSLLHYSSNATPSTATKPGFASSSSVHNSKPSDPKVAIASCSYSRCTKQQIILATAVVEIINSKGEAVPCRLLLDSASQSNFITASFFDALGLPKSNCNISIHSINNNITKLSHSVNATLRSRVTPFTFNLNLHIIPKITDRIPLTRLDCAELTIPQNLHLADPEFDIPHKIDALVGAELFWSLILPGQLQLGKRRPVLQNTQLGWVFSGSMKLPNLKESSSTCMLSIDAPESLDDLISQFWTLEEVQPTKLLSLQEMACEESFLSTTSRDTSGRFHVEFPFADDPKNLGDSYEPALRRFMYLERRLNKDPSLKNRYSEFLNDYLQQDHMEEVVTPIEGPSFYLPHHPVFKEGSSTTKLRVVFDASAKSSSGLSLNNILQVGPTLQRDLFSILVSFRLHAFALIADIKQMYRQVRIAPQHSNLQLILWRDSPIEEIKTFRLKTVTYGTASAAYLAVRCLLRLAELEGADLDLAHQVITQNFYVDDAIFSCDDLDLALQTQGQLIKLLGLGQFELHKWVANHPSLLSSIPPSHRDSNYCVREEGDRTKVKTLGMLWEPDSDHFNFFVPPYDMLEQPTKRLILSEISKLFDPLGLVAPLIVRAKLIMQELWALREDWDQPVPINIQDEWKSFRNELIEINSVTIPRHIKPFSSFTITSLEGFCDASERAYGCSIYLKSHDDAGIISVRLLCAKSKVAPLKRTTLPRLELCGALLLARLVSKVSSSIDIKLSSVNLWCDSTVALTWISAESSRWRTFIANRVAEIQRLTSSCSWLHVRSADNPADILSRGCSPSQLLESTLWWRGPSWLSSKSSETSVEPTEYDDEANTELKAVKISLSLSCNPLDLFSRYSSLSKLLSVTAYCLRFSKNCKGTNSRDKCQSIHLQPIEYTNALTVLIKIAQSETFHDDITSLKIKSEVRCNSKLRSLYPILDDAGVIRVGGRLELSSISFSRKHPILLPSKHSLSKLIAEDVHLRNLHAGPQLLLASVRQRFWPLQGKVLSRQVVKSCIICARAKPKPQQQLMGNLPASRITPNPPFYSTGVDFFGPITVKRVLQRGKSTFKAYGALFICLVTRAIHLELVSSLTSADFLACLKRFCARRGIPRELYCDNASTFVGAKNEINSIKKMIASDDSIIGRLRDLSINFSFIPPRSPNFGGLWEAGVKTVKSHLYKVLKSALLTFEEVNTLLVEIEACVNSRPISPLSEDPSDLTPLTPGHFLIGQALNTLPEADVQDLQLNRLSRWQLVQRLKQGFWKRWSTEYLATLQTRVKWQHSTPNLYEGALVVLKEEFVPPSSWLLGRIVALHPGEDGHCRVATVKTRLGNFKRAISKLCLLPNPTIAK